MKRKRRYIRGYPVAVLVGFKDDHAVLWRIFSRVVKLFLRLEPDGKRTDEKALYNFHESIVNALKPLLKEGIRSIVIAAPARTNYTRDFLEHVQKHHRYLLQSLLSSEKERVVYLSPERKLSIWELTSSACSVGTLRARALAVKKGEGHGRYLQLGVGSNPTEPVF